MTDRELRDHYKTHLDRVTKELITSESKVRKLEDQISNLKRTNIKTPNYEGQIDFEGGWGWLEHNKYGEENACRFFFDKKDDGTYEINDYEFCFEMNKEILSCLMQHDVFLVEV